MMQTLLYINKIGRTVDATDGLYDYSSMLFYIASLSPFLLFALMFIILSKGINKKLSKVDPHLIILAGVLVKKDEKVSSAELNKIKQYLKKRLTKKKAVAYYKLFERSVKVSYDLDNLIEKCNYTTIFQKINYNPLIRSQEKVKWMHFLISVAVADRLLSNDELEILEKIRKGWKLPLQTFNSILAMFNYYTEEELYRQKTVKQYTTNSIDRYYNVLGISSSATVNEIKSAYREMVKLYHPDKQIGNRKDKNTKVRFQQVQDAYQIVKEFKGFK